jgi:hypothetical protein
MAIFNPPPNWPAMPDDWTPPTGWRPDPNWGPPPKGWDLWIDDDGEAATAPYGAWIPDQGPRGLESRGLFGSLFDFGFTSFITLRFLRVIYAILVALVLLIGLAILVGGLAQGGLVAVAAVIAAPLAALLYLIFIRIALEAVALFFRIGENVSLIAESLTRLDSANRASTWGAGGEAPYGTSGYGHAANPPGSPPAGDPGSVP